MAPLHFCSPARRAGPAHIHRTNLSIGTFRSVMSVHITERLSCTEEIPPQARKKSPMSLHFNSGGDGEWSDATRSMVPFASPFQRRLRLSFSRMGGAHLNSVAPRPMSRGE